MNINIPRAVRRPRAPWEWVFPCGWRIAAAGALAAATEAYLRINGEMQGRVSLKNSAGATQAALGRCYRY